MRSYGTTDGITFAVSHDKAITPATQEALFALVRAAYKKQINNDEKENNQEKGVSSSRKKKAGPRKNQ